MIDIAELIKLHIDEGKSLRGACRDLGIPEGNKGYLGRLLREAGYEVRRGKSGAGVGDKIKVICSDCGKQRFIICKSVSKPYAKLCGSCATAKSHKDNPRIGRAENHYNWKGGINLNRQGYIVEYVNKNSPFFSMAANSHRAGGYILQHRFIMAKHLGRCLKPTEIVHHINGIRDDNRLENLKLLDRTEHNITYQAGFRAGYEKAMKDNGKHWNGNEWMVRKEG